MTSSSRCWFCSGEIRETERARVVADLDVLVHVACFDRLYESTAPKPWSADDRPAAARDQDDDDDEAEAS